MSAGEQPRRVAAAVVLHEGRVLVQTRGAPGRFAGLWEFPGGGIEPGESAADCARRECHEELGLSVIVGEALHAEEWSYPEAHVRVEFLLCGVAAGSRPVPRLGQELLWAGRADLERLAFLPANARVLELLRQRLP